MQNQNWRFFSRVVAIATMTVMAASLTTLGMAQRISAEERTAIFASAPRIQTSVKGVTAIAGTPKDFNPLTATNRELFSYGLPQRPDKATDAKAYELWEKGMSALKACYQKVQQPGRTTSPSNQVCHATDVHATPYSSRPMQPINAPAKTSIDGTISEGSYNWSGIANFNKLKAWNVKTSFDEVVSYWPVPVSNHPFGNLPCSEGPWFEVTWNGIGGFTEGSLVQGGSADYWDDGGCGGPVEYYGWVEWVPSYPILELYCGSNPCPVGPGDDFVTITYGTKGIAEQYVFVEDIQQQWSGTFGMTYVSGPGLIGTSAEYIVERPYGYSGSSLGFYPLANYVFEWFDAYAYNGAGAQFYPGNPGATTAIFTMYADDGTTPLSTPIAYGTAGSMGKYGIWLENENCSYSGGCTP
jgi:hypothetical protein